MVLVPTDSWHHHTPPRFSSIHRRANQRISVAIDQSTELVILELPSRVSIKLEMNSNGFTCEMDSNGFTREMNSNGFTCEMNSNGFTCKMK